MPEAIRASGTSPLLANWRARLESIVQVGPDAPAPGAARSHHVAAAVLVAIVDHAAGPSVLLTLRASHLRQHSGQVSFPGGRIESTDEGPAAAALREAQEEIGLTPDFVSVLGYLPDQSVRSGFRITPVVGIVRPGFHLHVDPTEVAEAFEVPLAHLLDPLNHVLETRVIQGISVQTRAIAYAERDIWGATATILNRLRERFSA